MPDHAAVLEVDHEVLGPWSLRSSREFWEGFTPAALPEPDAPGESGEPGEPGLRTVFLAEADHRRAEVVVTQTGSSAHLVLRGRGDLAATVPQVLRFVSLDVDARDWPDVARRDVVIAEAQARFPGLRPCGFHSPYEAAAWSVLSQRIQMRQAAKLRRDLVDHHGEDGAFPAPEVLRTLELDLPGRKLEYLHAVAEAALDGVLDGAGLRALPAEAALRQVREVKGLGPFAAELVVIRGAGAPDVLPRNEHRLNDEIAHRYRDDRTPDEIAAAWAPFRSWAAFHLRVLRGRRD